MILQSLPGGSSGVFQGHTTVHEVGHWLGLLHTFTGGCTEQNGGDLICDTPAEAFPGHRPDPKTSECPHDRDTCKNTHGPSDAGLDPIHNFMNFYDEYAIPSKITEAQN